MPHNSIKSIKSIKKKNGSSRAAKKRLHKYPNKSCTSDGPSNNTPHDTPTSPNIMMTDKIKEAMDLRLSAMRKSNEASRIYKQIVDLEQQSKKIPILFDNNIHQYLRAIMLQIENLETRMHTLDRDAGRMIKLSDEILRQCSTS
jgi:hypothetical protein